MAASTIPKTMNAVRFDKIGGPEVLEYTSSEPVPALRDGEVLVRNNFVGVNFIDTYFRTGVYKAPFPQIPGREAAGVIADVHPSAHDLLSALGLKVGDRVAYLGTRACATYAAVLATKLVAIPESVPSDVAAAVLLQGLTATTFVREAGQVKKGQWVLVQAAAGGVGLNLCQILREVGAKVIGCASTEEKCELAKKHGAEWTILSGAEDLVDQVSKITGQHGVDVIFDGVGKDTFESAMAMIARKGTIVSFGNASGLVPPVDILRLGPKCIRLMRPVVNNYLVEREELEQYSSELFGWVSSGGIKTNVYKTYGLKDVAQAQIDLTSRKTTGKLVIRID
jgi:NADPH2:quinone reductase